MTQRPELLVWFTEQNHAPGDAAVSVGLPVHLPPRPGDLVAFQRSTEAQRFKVLAVEHVVADGLHSIHVVIERYRP